MTAAPAALIVIFGATGDLAQRMLLPSLYRLGRDGLLPPGIRILCTARNGIDAAAFRRQVAESIERHVTAEERDDAAVRSLLASIDYLPATFGEAASAAALTGRIAEHRAGCILYHVSTAPRLYAPICAALGAAGLAGTGTRLMLEKPIGHDRASAIEISDGVAAAFDESRVFRVDHYLGKEGVQNLIALRFGNALFEPLWNARHVEQVQITVAETIGVEGRGGYYDAYGAARDMLQSHLLQLLCLTAMEPPSQFAPEPVRNEKLKVLHALRPIGAAEIAMHCVTGQYTAGAVGGAAVPGYRDELGHASDTETFIALRAQIDNWRWSSVPFYLRTGKRMARRSTEIYLQFRCVPHSIFAGSNARIEPNALVIRLQPEERIELMMMHKRPGLDRSGLQLVQVALDLDLRDAFAQERRRPAYERLYLDALEGNGTLFVRRDETETAWQWIDGILEARRRQDTAPRPYPAGTWGPVSAVSLADRHGHAWRE